MNGLSQVNSFCLRVKCSAGNAHEQPSGALPAKALVGEEQQRQYNTDHFVTHTENSERSRRKQFSWMEASKRNSKSNDAGHKQDSNADRGEIILPVHFWELSHCDAEEENRRKAQGVVVVDARPRGHLDRIEDMLDKHHLGANCNKVD